MPRETKTAVMKQGNGRVFLVGFKGFGNKERQEHCHKLGAYCTS